MTKYNQSAKYIEHVYKQEIKKENELLEILESTTNLDINRAFGNIQIQVDDVFQTENNGLDNTSRGYGGLDFLGNINGKCERQLFFKNENLKKQIESYRRRKDVLRDEISEAIKEIEKDHGKPQPQHAVIAHNLKH